MRPYETVVVLTNDLVSEQKALLERFTSVITTGGGKIDASHDWGNRRLAYPIKKQGEGHYYLLEYEAEPAVVSELERTLRITDGVLRYMSVQQAHTGLPKPRPREERERGDVPLHEMRGGPGGYRPRRDYGESQPATARPDAAPSQSAPAATPTAAPSSPGAAAAAPSAEPKPEGGSAGETGAAPASPEGVKNDE